MNKYFAYMIASIKKEIFYKANMVGLILTSLFILIIQVQLWNAIYAKKNLIQGIGYSSIFAYLVVGTIFRKFIGNGVDMSVSNDFRNGRIVIDLIKPQSYFLKVYFKDLGRGLVHVSVIGIVVALFCIFNIKRCKHYSLETLVFVGVSCILAYMIYFMMSYCIGLVSIWTGTSVGLSMIKNGLFALLGGTLIPIDFYPLWFATVVKFFPFKYIYYSPISFLLNEKNINEAMIIIYLQIVWCVIFAILSNVIYSKAHKYMVVQGG